MKYRRKIEDTDNTVKSYYNQLNCYKASYASRRRESTRVK